MGEKLEKTKNAAKKVGTGFLQIMKAFGEGVAIARETAQEYEHPETKLNLQTDITLKAEDLKQLRDMSSWQLEKIFRGKRVHLADDPAVYRELKHFDCWKLDAIFGKDGM